MIARSDPMADASLPAMRARRSPGIATAAMMPMMATTINSSISVKPRSVFRMTPVYGSAEQGRCHTNEVNSRGKDDVFGWSNKNCQFEAPTIVRPSLTEDRRVFPLSPTISLADPWRHDPQEHLFVVLPGGGVGRPRAHPELVRHDPGAGAKLAPQLRLEPGVDPVRQPQRDDRRGGQIGGEQVALDERRAIADLALPRHLPGDLHEMRIDLDADRARAVLLRGQHDDAAVAGSEIVDDVVRGHAREAQHSVGDRHRRRRKMNGRRLRRRREDRGHKADQGRTRKNALHLLSISRAARSSPSMLRKLPSWHAYS